MAVHRQSFTPIAEKKKRFRVIRESNAEMRPARISFGVGYVRFYAFWIATLSKQLYKSIGNTLKTSAIRDLHYSRYFKILSKLHEPLGEYDLKEFLNIRGVNCLLLNLSYSYSFIIVWLRKLHTRAR